MATAVWKGDLSIGLVSVPVAAFVAAEDSPGTARTTLHAACMGPINQHRVCVACDKHNLSLADTLSGVKQADGRFVIVTKEELDGIKVASSATIAVEAFVPATDVDPLYISNTYYLAPHAHVKGTAPNTQGFALLRDAMLERDVMLTGRVVMHNRERRVAIRPFGAILALQILRTHADLREATALPHATAVTAKADPQQLQLMGQLIDMYSGAFNPTAYEDAYVAAFHQLVEAKRTGAVLPVAVEKPSAPVVDFMAALKQSLAAAPPIAAAVPKAAKPVKTKKAA